MLMHGLLTIKNFEFKKSKVADGHHFAKLLNRNISHVQPFSRLFQYGGRCHLGFSKIQNFNIQSNTGSNGVYCAKFHQNQQNGCDTVS